MLSGLGRERRSRRGQLLFLPKGRGVSKLPPAEKQLSPALPRRKVLECQAGSKHLDRVEIKFGVERASDVGGLAKPVLFAGEQEVADRLAALPQRRDHGFGLARGHDLVLVTLEEDDRPGQAIGMKQR